MTVQYYEGQASKLGSYAYADFNRSIPAAASTFAAYEITREYLQKTTGI
jgi:hypothetical protein